MSWNEYPGQGYHQQQRPPPPQQYNQYQQQPQYNYGYQNNPPPPPPQGGGWGAPPPPQSNYGGYAPPPPQQYQNQGGYTAPTGVPPPSNYQAGSSGMQPVKQQQGYQPPYGDQQIARPPTQNQSYGPQFQGQGGPQRPFFQYSQCTGTRKALCIGINYFGSSSELKGCINDARNVEKFLCQRYGYKSEDIVMLTDDARNPRQIPTKANIIQAMNWLVAGAKPNDALFFHYSGHGGQTADLDGDEDDGFDEVIYPLDFKQAGHIVDDDMHAIMVRQLPPGCRLTAIFDSCHSGTALDLPYVYSTEGVIKEPNLLAEAGQGLLGAGMSYLRGDIGGMMKGVMSLGKNIMNQNSGAAEKTRQSKTSPADAISFSGCKDSQTSADTSMAGQATGAMSYAFIAALTRYPQQSYVQLLNSIRDELKGKYDQKPQLSASHPIDTNLLFIC